MCKGKWSVICFAVGALGVIAARGLLTPPAAGSDASSSPPTSAEPVAVDSSNSLAGEEDVDAATTGDAVDADALEDEPTPS